MGFEVLGGVAWGFIDDFVDVRHISGRHGQKYIEKLFRIGNFTVIAKQSEDTAFLAKTFFHLHRLVLHYRMNSKTKENKSKLTKIFFIFPLFYRSLTVV